MIEITEQNISQYIGKEVFCTATEEKVLLKGYRGRQLAQIRNPEKFTSGKYVLMSHDCLLANLKAYPDN